jgi:uncharacterized MAPEG superfamily protein
MTRDLRLLVYSAVLAWVMVITSSLLRTLWWRGFGLAFGNRDDLPEPLPIAARADRAARNMLENLLIFAVLVVAAHLGGIEPSRLDLGAELFFWARLAYFPVYLAGIRYLRTALWSVGVAGLGAILATML